MPSPFPGMDPYLEYPAHWRGVHAALIVACYETLNALLPDGFIARIEERLTILTPERSILPDVSVHRVASPPIAPQTVMVVGDAPARVRASLLEVPQRFIEIVSLSEPEEIITAIEFLSISNKTPGDGREEYVRKQQRLLRSSTHLLEIDLLRAGRHTVAAAKDDLETFFGHWDYVVSLHRAGEGAECDAWARTLRQVLPTVPVPLTSSIPDIRLDVQALLDHVWDRGPFRKTLAYRDQPFPPLKEEDTAWADALLKARGLR
ncbi:DUF4058 family protein [Armatimonas sp.]|uniref:DUF4058 family protein n=1 Tax=Armatimonas sp. TaxID=1872638 RepID=UPI00286BCDB3|nr:DUF4058 family protein [Armatimonas sp.]